MNAFSHLVRSWYDFHCLGQKADFVNRELELSRIYTARSRRPNTLSPPLYHEGAWERLFRSVKKFCFDILEAHKINEEIPLTTFRLVEQSLNNLLLTPVISDSNYLEDLTTYQFLLGQRAVSFPQLEYEQNFNHRKRYALAQSYAKSI